MFSISIVWGSGVLLTVDGRALDPDYREPRNYRVIVYSEDGREKPLALISGYGDESILESVFQIVEDVFYEWFDSVGSKSWRNPGDTEVKRLISEVEERIMERYRGLKSFGVSPNTHISIGTVTQDGSPRLYYIDGRGLATPRHSAPGYIVLGPPASVYIAEAILRLLSYSPQESGRWNLGLLSAFVLQIASEVDPNVSPNIGDSLFMRYDPNEKDIVVGSIKDQAISRMRDRLERRKEAFKLLWRSMDILGDDREDRVIRLLRNMVEGQKMAEDSQF